MKYALEISPKAERSLEKIPRKDFLMIDPSIRVLGGEPRPPGVKKLKEDIHRIRVGAWRIIYVISDERRLVSILDVVRRSKTTYKRYRG